MTEEYKYVDSKGCCYKSPCEHPGEGPCHMPARRLETNSEHIARDIREGRFPQRSEPRPVLGDPDTTQYAQWSGEAFKFHSRDQIIEYANACVRAALAKSAVIRDVIDAWDAYVADSSNEQAANLFVLAMNALRDGAPPAKSADLTNADREKALQAHAIESFGERTAFRCGWNSALARSAEQDRIDAELPDNIDWTLTMSLAEKHGDGWSDEKGWSFKCDDDLFNFAGELIDKGASK